MFHRSAPCRDDLAPFDLPKTAFMSVTCIGASVHSPALAGTAGHATSASASAARGSGHELTLFEHAKHSWHARSIPTVLPPPRTRPATSSSPSPARCGCAPVPHRRQEASVGEIAEALGARHSLVSQASGAVEARRARQRAAGRADDLVCADRQEGGDGSGNAAENLLPGAGTGGGEAPRGGAPNPAALAQRNASPTGAARPLKTMAAGQNPVNADLQHVQPDEGGEQQEPGREEDHEKNREEDMQPATGEDGAVDGHGSSPFWIE